MRNSARLTRPTSAISITCVFRSRIPGQGRQSEDKTPEAGITLSKHVVQTYTQYTKKTNNTGIIPFPSWVGYAIIESLTLIT